MIPKTTMYYGKKYTLVFKSKSRSETNIYASVLNKIFDEYDYGHDKKLINKTKNLILIEHNDGMHLIYIKQPYDKIVKKI